GGGGGGAPHSPQQTKQKKNTQHVVFFSVDLNTPTRSQKHTQTKPKHHPNTTSHIINLPKLLLSIYHTTLNHPTSTSSSAS
ncbi:UNVERIFIED_CONTAM: hypothetical protein NY603_38365, partial [Bacteroidetes bacterium 56_B9]